MRPSVRIGCFSGFWGDSATGAFQLVRQGDIDYLVGDYLAEVTMAILARHKQSAKGSRGMGEGGYVAEFVTDVFSPLLKEIAAKGIKVVTNAGGMNPLALKRHLEKVASAAGISLTVAAITGDDVVDSFAELSDAGHVRLFDIEGVPEKPPARPMLSSNAYLGAFPIALALNKGAQVVVTGRCVDSAIVLGPLIHEFGWGREQYNFLAAGSIAGHLIECGAHATGGNFTDWRLSHAQGWHNVGYPIAQCYPDGVFEITKPPNTGGLVSVATVAEQLVYEIHDPGNYFLPDVIVDLTQVKLELLPSSEKSAARVRVTGSQGRAPSTWYKVSNTYLGEFKLSAMLMIGGREARDKALAVGEAIIQKTREMFKEAGLPDYSRISMEALGSEFSYGPHSRARESREVILRLVATHKNRKALDNILAKEITPAALSMAPGITGGDSGRPRSTPELLYSSCLVRKTSVRIGVHVGMSPMIEMVDSNGLENPILAPAIQAPIYKGISGPTKTVPLISICYGRSGDKGDVANIGVVCRDPSFFPILAHQLTSEAVKGYMGHLLKGKIIRYVWPGISALNFVCTNALDSGGTSSLRMDRQGKCYAQMLLDFPIEIPASLVSRL